MPKGQKASPATRKGNGIGIGGPANGPGQKGPGPRRNVGVGLGARTAAIEAKAERAERAMEVLAELMDGGETGMVRLAAANSVLNRIEGTAISRSMKVDGDELSKLSDAEIAERIAALERVASEARRGAAPAVVPGEPSRLVN